MPQEARPVTKAHITNANHFCGKNENLAESTNVPIARNGIAKSIPNPGDAMVIDA